MYDGTLEHLALGFFFFSLAHLLHGRPWPAIWALVTLELTQLEAFRNPGFDYLHDLAADAVGAFYAVAIFQIHF